MVHENLVFRTIKIHRFWKAVELHSVWVNSPFSDGFPSRNYTKAPSLHLCAVDFLTSPEAG